MSSTWRTSAVAIGGARHLRNVAGDRRVGIEPSVADDDAGQRAGHRLADREDDMRRLRAQPVVIALDDANCRPQHQQPVGGGLDQQVRPTVQSRPSAPGRRSGRPAAPPASSAPRPDAAPDLGGGHDLPHILERPAIERRQPPIGQGHLAAGAGGNPCIISCCDICATPLARRPPSALPPHHIA